MNIDPDTFVAVCGIEDLAVGTPALAEVGGVRMALVRVAPAEVHAIADQCSHANVSLAEGEVDGCTLECWLHGSRFDLHTGAPTGPPATVPVPVYPVRIVDGTVLVSPIAGPTHVPTEVPTAEEAPAS